MNINQVQENSECSHIIISMHVLYCFELLIMLKNKYDTKCFLPLPRDQILICTIYSFQEF